jgi:hypothetical protein
MSRTSPTTCISALIYQTARVEEIDVAFQMDGGFAQQPYTPWLDKVTLSATHQYS